VSARVAASFDVSAPVEKVFAAMVDLRSQDKWILATTLFALDGDVEVPFVGSKIAALTGLAGVGVLDTMTVTVYEPPNRWITEHTGNAFKGTGTFQVESAPGGARVTWAEEIELPLGILGRLGWKVAEPLVRWGLTASLKRLAKGVMDGSFPVTGSGQKPRLSR
jgi:carbon monoxide dehydrogenase subunit G